MVEDERLVGIVTESDLLGKIVEGQASLSSAVAEVMFRSIDTVHVGQDAGALLDIYSKDEVGLIVDDEGHLLGIITKMDLVDHLTHGAGAQAG